MDFHREDGSAVVAFNGYKEWIFKNKRHRIGGPAVEHSDGSFEYWEDGNLHRIDGPAVKENGFNYWYYKGREVKCSSQEEFERIIKLRAFW